MPRVRAILPQVNTCPSAQPSQCLYCECGILHRHGEVQKHVKDIYVVELPRCAIAALAAKIHSRAIRNELTAMDAASG